MSFLTSPRPRPNLAPCRVGDRRMEFGRGVFMMGVVNVTPDSFSDGGAFFDTDAAIAQGLSLWEAGATILDIGGESTRPGAEPVSLEEEMARVLPVIEGLRQRCDAWLSVDTYKAAVAAAAVDAGADLVNDISALGFDDAMATTVAEKECALVLMHIRKEPRTMQHDIVYDDLIGDIMDFLRRRIARATAAGVAPSRIFVDPGIGFGKTVAQNYEILRRLSEFTTLGHPLLIGTSRKSFLGAVTGRPPQQRRWATAASVASAVLTGADIVRVHDVAEMKDVVRIAEAICAMEQGSEAKG